MSQATSELLPLELVGRQLVCVVCQFIVFVLQTKPGRDHSHTRSLNSTLFSASRFIHHLALAFIFLMVLRGTVTVRLRVC